MTNGEDTHFVGARNVPVECDEAGLAVRDHELAQIRLNGAPDEWVVFEQGDRAADPRDRGRGRVWIIEQEPDKYWLYFCLGMINHRYKGDLVSARRDFQQFLDRADRTRFPRQVAATERWTEEIDVTLRPAAPANSA